MLKKALTKIFDLLNSKERTNAYILFILMIMGSVLEIFSLGLLPGFITLVSKPEIIEKYIWIKKLTLFLSISNQSTLILYGSITIIIVFVLKNIFTVFLTKRRFNYVTGIQVRLSSELLRLYYNAPYSFHLNRNTADFLGKLSDEVRLMISNVLLPFISLLMDIIFTVSTVILLIIVEPVISISAFILFGIAGTGYWYAVRKKSMKYGSQLSFIRSRMNKNIIEGFGGLKDARVLNREKYFINNTINSFKKTAEATLHQNIVGNMSRPVIETIAIIGMLSIVISLVIQEKPMSNILSILALFGIAAIRLLPTVNQVITGFANIRTFLFVVDPVYDLSLIHI